MAKVIAIDVDDVLAASAEAWVKYSNQRWGTNLTVDDYHEDWAKMWSVDRLTESQRAQEIYAARVTRDFPHYPDARVVLEKLSRNYKLVIVTSRVQIALMKQDTLDWLEKYFKGLFEEVHYSGIYDAIAERPLKAEGMHKATKAQLCREIGADYLIDDQPKHCLAVAEAGIETILFGDYPWNRLKRLPEGVTRCESWLAVSEYFDARG